MTDPAAEGRRLAKAGDFEAALPLLEQAVRDSPDSPDAWLALGACFFRLDRNDDFRESLRRALDIDPNHQPTRRFLRNLTGSDQIPARDPGRAKIFMEDAAPPGRTAAGSNEADPATAAASSRSGCALLFVVPFLALLGAWLLG